MLIATWNVNSIRARLERLVELLERHRPLVVCLQETKVDAAAFPHRELAAAGYAAVDHSGGRWCGVAVLVRGDATPRGVPGFADDPTSGEARWVEAQVGSLRVVSVYAPNGRSPDSDQFAIKLAFFEAAARRLRSLAADHRPLVVAGDMNVAPADLDVWDAAAFVGQTHVTPQERAVYAAFVGGLADAYRVVHPGDPGHTWWDYRAGAYHRREGMRIDHMLVTADVAARLRDAFVDRDFRKGMKPSDHAPLLVEIADR